MDAPLTSNESAEQGTVRNESDLASNASAAPEAVMTDAEGVASGRLPGQVATPQQRPHTTESSSSESDVSDYGADHSNDDGDDADSLEYSSGDAKRKTSKKQTHALDNTPSRGGDGTNENAPDADPSPNRPRKRAKTTQTQAQNNGTTPAIGPQNKAAALVSSPADFMNFSATIFVIYLGQSDVQYHAHESVLLRSTKMVDEVQKAKNKGRRTQQHILKLGPHDPQAFSQMLQYLYKDDFVPIKENRSRQARMKELLELMSLAKFYNLLGLQKLVMSHVRRSKVSSRATFSEFFEWAEDMYCEELDHTDGQFKTYFRETAPELIQKAEPKERERLSELIRPPAAFGKELFKVTLEALAITQQEKAKIKKEVQSIKNDTSATNGQSLVKPESDTSLFVPQ